MWELREEPLIGILLELDILINYLVCYALMWGHPTQFLPHSLG